ncbi:MAG TPA: ferrous iron transport protein A [Firmicutes bacterium]|nr:ferrous iron transport protein A [Bacillota bacterium]
MSPARSAARSAHLLSLAELRPGERGRIVSLRAPGPVLRRLLEMGVLPGTEIAVKGVAPLGDPMVIAVKGYRLSIRKYDGSGVLVEPTGTDRILYTKDVSNS